MFYLAWYRHPAGADGDGYRFSSRGKGLIERVGDQLERYEPLEIPGLGQRLTKYDATPHGALELTKKFGFPLHAKQRVERISSIVDVLRNLQSMVRMVEKQRWESVAHRLDGAYDVPSMHRFSAALGTLGVLFTAPLGGERPSFRLRPANLFEGAVVKLLAEAASGTKIKRCMRPGCLEYFIFGAGTGRRSTALYCSSRCRSAHEYMKRTGVTP